MAFCKTKRINKNKLCTGDLDKLIDIKERQVSSGGIGDNTASETFVTVKDNVFAGIETPSGIAFYNGVNINELQSTMITHKFFIFYDPDFPNIENGNHYIFYNNDRFKVIRVTNDNEQNEFMIIETTNRGDEDKEAVNA